MVPMEPAAAVPSPQRGILALLLSEPASRPDGEGIRATDDPGGRLTEIVAEAAARYGGRPTPASGTTVQASSFERVSDAVRAAIDAQRAIAAEAWPSSAPRRARLAVHAGEVESDDEGRLTGPTMHRAERLLAAANGGQVLVSGAAAELLAAPPVPEVDLFDLGLQRLTDVDAPVRVHELRGGGLESRPLRTIDVVPNNLPRAPTPLVGRADLVAELRVAVASFPLICLTGAGGCGKTRLALELAASAVERFDGGIWWVDLAAVADGDGIDEAIAAAIGIRPATNRGLRSRVLETLRHADCLVVLDNCEHLLDHVVALVRALMASNQRIHVVATSREPLGVDGEVVRRVPSLDLPAGDTVEALRGSGSGELLLDRLARAGGGRDLSADEAGAAAEICRRLDGIPLAIELAAARARTMALPDLADGLVERFRLLTGGRRDVRARQRTLEASVAWSHDLLTEHERVVLRRLATFPAAFTAAHAAEVVADDHVSAEEVRDLCARLVDRSLLTLEPEGDLRMLETVRAFAEDRLRDAGEVEALCEQHLAWVARWAAAIEPDFDGPDPATAIQEVDRRLLDVRAALRHADGRRDAAAMWSIVGSLATYFWYQGHLTEALDWLARAEANDPDLDPARQVTGRTAAALLSTSVGVHEALVAACETARDVARAAGDRAHEGRALILLGAHQTFGDVAGGRPLIAAGRALCAEAGDDLWAAWADCSGGLASVFEGRPVTAIAQLDAAEATLVRTRSLRLRLDVDSRRVCAQFQLGEFAEARTTAAAGLARAEGFAAINVVATFHGVSAWIDALSGHPDRAEASMRTAIGAYVRDGELQFVPFFVAALGHALLASGRPAEAIAAAEPVRAHPDVERATQYRAWLDDVLARAHLTLGDSANARAVARRMAQQARAAANRLEAARAGIVLAALDRLEGEHRRAETHAHDALTDLLELGARHWATEALDVVALLDADAGRHDRAATLHATAAAERTDRGVTAVPSWMPVEAAGSVGTRTAEVLDLAAAAELASRGRGDRGRPTAGWDSLTPTELEVAALVAEGLTNPAIAERLLMGRATAKTHVSNALRKLDLETRTQLATAFAARHRS